MGEITFKNSKRNDLKILTHCTERINARKARHTQVHVNNTQCIQVLRYHMVLVNVHNIYVAINCLKTLFFS